MYIFGLLVYITIPVLAFFFETARGFIVQCFSLSPEITVLIAIAYLYPFSVFMVAYFFKNKKLTSVEYFRGQVNLSSSLAVSFGLIGTFIGLANMIAGIAAGLNAEGDFTQRMAMLLQSIGLALDSMSLAFLTSILGVGTSVSILFASNYLNSFFDVQASEDDEQKTGNKVSHILDSDHDVINQNFERVHHSLKQTLELVNNKENVFTDLHTLLESNSGSTVVQQFNDSLVQHNQIALSQAEQINIMRDEQQRTHQAVEQLIGSYSESMHSLVNVASSALNNMASRMDAMAATNENMERILAEHTDTMRSNVSDATDAVDGMSSKVELMADTINQSAETTVNVIEQTTSELGEVASILHDIRVATAVPIEESLKNAINEGSFSLTFQPQTLFDGTITGAESFIRWVDPVRGSIPNNELFKLAKREGLSVELDKWVAYTTINQVSDWQKLHKWKEGLVASINVTSELLLDPTFIINLETIFKESLVQPGSIAVEITENTIAEDSDAVRDKIRQLHNLGMKIFIDNFGTGYTSLINLQDLKIDRLKIDRNIINRITAGDDSGLAVIKSVMMLTGQIDVEVQADGVENQDQVDQLVEVGCKYFQGYHFGKPVSFEEFEDGYLVSEESE